MEGVYGEIKAVGYNFAPRNWAKCQGQLLPISSNSALFSLLGTIYGGDGRTTFALPDLRGRVAIGEGSGPGLPNYRIGQRGGQATTTLSTANLPSHHHSVATQPANLETGSSEVMVGGSGQGSSVTGNSGGNQAFNNMQPYLVVNYIICIEGTFPSRS